jgi:hypothetical protein
MTKRLEEVSDNQDKNVEKYISQITLLNQNIFENKKQTAISQEEISNLRE